MKITGYCDACRRVRPVRVSGHALAVARGGVVQGKCDDCQEKEDARHRGVIPNPARSEVVAGWERRRLPEPDVAAVKRFLADGRPGSLPAAYRQRARSLGWT